MTIQQPKGAKLATINDDLEDYIKREKLDKVSTKSLHKSTSQRTPLKTVNTLIPARNNKYEASQPY